MNILNILGGLIFLFLTVLAGWAQAETPPLEGLRVDSVGYRGTGCPQGTVSSVVSPDNSALSFLFSAFSLDLRPGVQGQRHCNMRFQVTLPVGYQLRVMQVDVRGFAALSPGASAKMSNQVLQHIAGNIRTLGETESDFRGPLKDLFTITTSSGDGVWSGCAGRTLTYNIISRFEVRNRSNDNALMSVDSADIAIGPRTTFYLAWSKCSREPRSQR